VARYFAAIYRPPAALDLDGYCARFRDQMATCVAIPTLALLRQGSPAAAEELRQILFGLGVAWRLLDDVQDAYADLLAGEQTILYLLLDEAARAKWTRCQLAGPADREQWPQLVEVLFRSGVLKQVLGRCCAELADAARLASGRGWDQLAEELRQLRHPVYDLVGRLP
jgi:geranylgeranyl pyrophosphate synthase